MRLFAVACLSAATMAAQHATPDRPPRTPPQPVTDRYHGVTVVDPYRWLENAADPEVRDWTAAQNRYTRAYLDRLPARPKIAARLVELQKQTTTHMSLQFVAGTLFAWRREPDQQQPVLVALKSPDDLRSARVILDPVRLDPSGRTTMDFYVPSLDGKLVAVSLSKDGTEDGTLHFFEAQTGRQLPDRIPRVTYPTAGGSVAWNHDGTGVFYTRFPAAGERPKEDQFFYQQVYFHQLGAPPERDAYVIGKEFPRIAEVDLSTRDDGACMLASVANGDGGEFAHYLRNAAGQWTQITRFEDKVKRVAFGRDGNLYLLSQQHAPRGKILRLPVSEPDLKTAVEIVPQGEAAIQSFVAGDTLLYVQDNWGGPSHIRAFELGGRERAAVPVKPVSAVYQMEWLPGDELLFSNVTFTEPMNWYRYSPASGKVAATAMVRSAPASLPDLEVIRDYAVSKDGTRVPLNILVRKGTKRDGTAPALLTGYGGYAASLGPFYAPELFLFLERGGVFALANLRGGGEYGAEWHEGGRLARKQNVFDDFVACAEHLVRKKYTSPARLAIQGGSNGGLLMGAVLTQRPELFRAIVSHVGIYDMLRVELDPNGEFNTTEYGSVKDPVLFKVLYAYSPYHRVKERAAYPAVLLLTGENDGRVNPAHSRKMAARLQAATASGRPVLLRTSATSGHGIGTAFSERVEQGADVFAFLFDQLGVPY